ncbi:hypothetical protein HCN44_009640 [Aphidius gifuensis]|uniref:Uncharacterized protein n=1 Tax=Aphidius gifuensis TaxID=684658 RepID=A0A834Y7S3_APHGI|nr:hypothetical protein HCN44_009640 [Aphidius gifuensis]
MRLRIHDMIQELDVIRYNKNGTFERVNQIKGMFDHARSLTSDYKTGKIYWIDHDHSGEYSIKVTDESFEKSEYVIHPSNQFMRNLRADPKRRKIFFSSIEHFWYASNSPNSTANLLFSSEVSFQFIIDFTIDYITDKLCWIERLNNDFYLYCVVIGTLDRPLNTTDIVTIEKFPTYIKTLLAFNNTYYWTTSDNYGYNLYFKNGNEAAVKKAEYFTFVHYSIVPSVCPRE